MILLKGILLGKRVNYDRKNNFSFTPGACTHRAGSYHLNKFDMI